MSKTLAAVHMEAVLNSAERISDTGYSTPDYGVGIGYFSLEDQERAEPVYLVINRVTGVCEFSTNVLCRSISVMGDLQQELDRLRGLPKPANDSVSSIQ